MELPFTIFDFNNHVSFLNAYRGWRQEQQPAFSLGTWARQLHIKHPSTLSNILLGRRLPGEELQSKFASYFRFDEVEEAFFSYLVQLSRSENQPKMRLLIQDELNRLHPNGEYHFLDSKRFAALSEWYHYAIREMIRLPSFQYDEDWIHSRLRHKVSKAKIREAINNLKTLGLVFETTDGRLETLDQTLTTTTDVVDEAIQKFHQCNLDLAKEAIIDVPVQERDFGCRYFSINSNRIAEMKQRIEKFREQLQLEFGSDDGDQIYQINTQLLPVTNNLGDLK